MKIINGELQLTKQQRDTIRDIQNSFSYEIVFQSSVNWLYFSLIQSKLQQFVHNPGDFRKLAYQVMLIQNPIPRLYMLAIIAKLDESNQIINVHNLYLQLGSVFNPIQQFFLTYTLITQFKQEIQLHHKHRGILNEAIFIYDKIDDGNMFMFLLNEFFDKHCNTQQIQQLLDILPLTTKDYLQMYLLDKISQFSAGAINENLKSIIQGCVIALRNQPTQYLIQEYILFITIKLLLFNMQKETVMEVITLVHNLLPFDLLLQILLKLMDIKNVQIYEGIYCSFDTIFGSEVKFEQKSYYTIIQLINKVIPHSVRTIDNIQQLLSPYNFVKKYTKENPVPILKIIIEIVYYNTICINPQDVQQLLLILQDIQDQIEIKDSMTYKLTQISERACQGVELQLCADENINTEQEASVLGNQIEEQALRACADF